MKSIATALLFLAAMAIAICLYAITNVRYSDRLIRSPLYYRNVKDVVVKTDDGEERVIGIDKDIESIEIHDMDERTTAVMQERRYTTWE